MKDALNYIYSFMGKKTLHKKNLEHINDVKYILDILGYRQTFKVIHVTGTKGKGSTTLVLSNMLKSIGYKTGAFISPHIINERERISINNEWISEDDFIDITRKIKKIADETHTDLTVFEIFTVMGLYYFYIKNADYACIEVGIGGKLDCTNIVDSSVSVLTSISYDHTEILGNTIEEITAQKSGIIKKDTVVVSACQEKESLNVIEKIAKSLNCELYVFKKDFSAYLISNAKEILEFDYEDGEKRYLFKTSLLGEHQSENVSLAFKAFTLLNGYDERLCNLAVDSVRNFRIDARLTFVRRNPDVIVDGAHNAKSLKVVLKTIYEWYDYIVILFAPLSEKDIKGMCDILRETEAFIIVSSPDTDYKERDSHKTYELLKDRKDVVHMEDFKEAVKYMQRLSKDKNLPSLVIGSLYGASDYINLNINI